MNISAAERGEAAAGLRSVLFALTTAIRFTSSICIYHQAWMVRSNQTQTQGEKYEVQVDMWRKTEVKCWHADVLADNT